MFEYQPTFTLSALATDARTVNDLLKKIVSLHDKAEALPVIGTNLDTVNELAGKAREALDLLPESLITLPMKMELSAEIGNWSSPFVTAYQQEEAAEKARQEAIEAARRLEEAEQAELNTLTTRLSKLGLTVAPAA